MHIGTIIFPETLLQEAEILGKYRLNEKSIGECNIEVYSNEGNIPHFHLFNTDHSFETCICIYSANFFVHGRKYIDTLNSSQCKILDRYLQSPCKHFDDITVWQAIRILWEVVNPNCRFPDSKKVYKQPDYTNTIAVLDDIYSLKKNKQIIFSEGENKNETK